MQTIDFPKPVIHVFVCVNDRSGSGSTKPSCHSYITPEMVKEVKAWLVAQGLSSIVYCTKVKCLGFCNRDGGVACVYPEGRFVKGLRSVSDIKEFIVESLKNARLKSG